jgi:hypothetical protein
LYLKDATDEPELLGLVESVSATAPLTTSGNSTQGLFHCYGFREVSGLVYVAAAADGDVVGEELEGDYF